MLTTDIFVGVGDTLSIKLRVGDKFQMLIGDLWLLKLNKIDKKLLPLEEGFMLGEIQWFFEFHGPPTPACQGPCGFDKGQSLVVK